MPLDRLLGHEQRLGDLAVGVPVGRLTADPPLRRGQRARPGQLDPRAPPRTRLQLRPGALGQRDGAAVVGELQRPSLDVPGLRAAAAGGPARRRDRRARARARAARRCPRAPRPPPAAARADPPRRAPPRRSAATVPSSRGAPTPRATASCSRASRAAASASPVRGERTAAAYARQSLGQCTRSASSRSPHQSRSATPSSTSALGDPQAPAGGEVLGDVHAILGDPQRVALAHQLGRRLQRPALDVGDDRDREQLQHGEVPLVDTRSPVSASTWASLSAPCASAIAARWPWISPCRATWPSRRAPSSAGVEHAHGQVVAPSEPQGLQREEGGARRRGRREPGGQRGLRLLHREPRPTRPPRRRSWAPWIRATASKPGWPRAASVKRCRCAPRRARSGTTAVVTISSADPELERALRVERAELVAERGQRVDGGLRRATAARDDRAAREHDRRVGPRRQARARGQRGPQMLLGRVELHRGDVVAAELGQDLPALLLGGRFRERPARGARRPRPERRRARRRRRPT